MADRIVSFRVSVDQYARIQEAAQAEGMTISQYVRRAVKWALILRGAKA